MWTAEEEPRGWLSGKCHLKPAVHLMADVFPVAEAILDEGDFVPGEQVEITSGALGDRLHGGAVALHVTAMPEGGGKGVGVAEEQSIGDSCSCVLAPGLLLGDGCELF